jgi:chromosomal replication initiation ATPase DnaA
MTPTPIEYQGTIYKTPTAHRKIAVIYMNEMCKEYNVSPKSITGKDRQQNLVDLRAMIARRLLNMGFSLLTVGYALSKDHTTIMHYKSFCYDHLGVKLNAKN